MAASVAPALCSQDVGNVLFLEHINLEVPDIESARLFFCEGLGLTLDPGTSGTQRGGHQVVWFNIGKQQVSFSWVFPIIIIIIEGQVKGKNPRKESHAFPGGTVEASSIAATQRTVCGNKLRKTLEVNHQPGSLSFSACIVCSGEYCGGVSFSNMKE